MPESLLDYMNLKGVGRRFSPSPVGLAIDQYGILNPPELNQGSDQPERFSVTAQEVLDYMALPPHKKLSYAKYRKGFDSGDIPFNLLDYSQQGRVFDDIEDVQRYVPPKGASQRIKKALSKRGLKKKLIAVAQRGAELMPDEWYGTNPLYQKYVELLGPEKAREKYKRDIWITAGTSARNDVPNNIKTASYYQYTVEQGLPLPEKTVTPFEAKRTGEPQYPPPGYGSIAQGTHLRGVKDVLETGQLEPFGNPKMSTFATNLLGNVSQVTIDTHNWRMLGMLTKDPAFLKTQFTYKDKNKKEITINPKQLVLDKKMSMSEALRHPTYWTEAPDAGSNNEYKYWEDYQIKLAKQLGISPAELQAKLWMGAGDLTGLRSPPEIFSKTVETRVKYTAEVLGKDPGVVLEQYILGEIPLAQTETEMTGLLG